MKQHTFKTALLALIVLVSITACKKDPVEEPNQEPNPLPANALVKHIKWSDTDHYTFTYNAQRQVTQLRSQWQSVIGDPTQIQIHLDDFKYDAQNRLVQDVRTGGDTVKYYYQGNLLDKTKEFRANGALSKEMRYKYAQKRLVQELWIVYDIPNQQGPDTLKHDFAYDANGNLNKVESYLLLDNGTYKLFQTTQYSDFDDKVNPTSWMIRYPYLPQMRLQINNPRKEVWTPVTGNVVTTTFAYTYNANGIPLSKKTMYTNGDVTTGQYQY